MPRRTGAPPAPRAPRAAVLSAALALACTLPETPSLERPEDLTWGGFCLGVLRLERLPERIGPDQAHALTDLVSEAAARQAVESRVAATLDAALTDRQEAVLQYAVAQRVQAGTAREDARAAREGWAFDALLQDLSRRAAAEVGLPPSCPDAQAEAPPAEPADLLPTPDPFPLERFLIGWPALVEEGSEAPPPAQAAILHTALCALGGHLRRPSEVTDALEVLDRGQRRILLDRGQRLNAEAPEMAGLEPQFRDLLRRRTSGQGPGGGPPGEPTRPQ